MTYVREPGKKIATLYFDCTDAWESWKFSVPEDATEEWIREHIDELWADGAALHVDDSGHRGMTLDEIEVEGPVEAQQERIV